MAQQEGQAGVYVCALIACCESDLRPMLTAYDVTITADRASSVGYSCDVGCAELTPKGRVKLDTDGGQSTTYYLTRPQTGACPPLELQAIGL